MHSWSHCQPEGAEGERVQVPKNVLEPFLGLPSGCTMLTLAAHVDFRHEVSSKRFCQHLERKKILQVIGGTRTLFKLLRLTMQPPGVLLQPAASICFRRPHCRVHSQALPLRHHSHPSALSRS